MKVSVVAFGKLKTPGLREAADHYLKHIAGLSALGARMRGFEEIELKPLPVQAKTPEARAKVRAGEAEHLESWCRARLSSSGRGGFVLLDESGEAQPTRAWAQRLERWEQQEGWDEAIFCVGGSLGFDPALRSKARWVVSLGPQTLPHELARVVLIEQLYRALSLRKGHPYHND